MNWVKLIFFELVQFVFIASFYGLKKSLCDI